MKSKTLESSRLRTARIAGASCGPILVLLVGALSAVIAAPPHPLDAADGFVTTRINDRIVKRFDFDERRHGNYESMPVSWRQIAAPNFPRYLEPSLDDTVGHDAPPSFKLQLKGGSLGAEYRAKDLNVHPNCRYRITGWIKPRRLRNSRAYLTAYYLDHALRPITAAQRRSAEIRGPGDHESWHMVSIDLPPGAEEARWIGLSCRVEQIDASGLPAGIRPIGRHDIHAAAWFDDLTITRLPNADLSLESPTGVYRSDEQINCRVTLEDLNADDLEVRLGLFDADGAIVRDRILGSDWISARKRRLPLGRVQPGLYHLRLSVLVSGEEASALENDLIVAAPEGAMTPAGAAFGLLLEPNGVAAIPIDQPLIEHLGPDVIKLPFWRSDMSAESVLSADPLLDPLLRGLEATGRRLVAVLDEPPGPLARASNGAPRSLIDALAAPPDDWRAYLTLVLMRYGSRVDAWQLAGDRDSALLENPKLPTVLTHLRAEIQSVIGRSGLIIPAAMENGFRAGADPEDIASIFVPAGISSPCLREFLADRNLHRKKPFWVTIELPHGAAYDRLASLADFARLLVVARESGAQSVFITQPWSIVPDAAPRRIVFREEFLVFRTLAHALRGMRPRAMPWLAPQLHASLFSDPDDELGTLVVWADGREPAPRPIRLDLGPNPRARTIWGAEIPIQTQNDFTSLQLSDVPIVVENVDVNRLVLQSGFALSDPIIPVSTRSRRREMRFTNGTRHRIDAPVVVDAPADWTITPRRFRLTVPPGETTAIPVDISLPTNQFAGRFELTARLRMGDSDRGILLRAPVQVGTPALDVQLLTSIDPTGLHIMQRMTNRSEESMSLRSFVLAPEHETLARLTGTLAPGQSVVEHFILDQAERLRGRPIRVSVEQLGGALRHHDVVQIE